MEMVSVPIQREGETQPFFHSSSPSSAASPSLPTSNSSLFRRPFHYRSLTWRRLLKWIWRDVALLCIGFLLGFLIIKLTIGPAKEEKRGGEKEGHESALDFFVIGDWGRRGLYNQSQVAIQMGRIGEKLNPEFVISAGDNFYPTGLKGTEDPDFTTSFTNVYTAPSLQIPWYAVLGNHDYMGDAIAQFSSELVSRDSRWYCKRDYEVHHSLCWDNKKSCKSSVDFFFIDTTTFVDEYWGPNPGHVFDWRGLAPRENQLKSQLENLASKLAKSSSTWKIVIGHHTIRSVGHHGDTKELVDKLLPLLEKYKVDLYFNGHDHNLQHIKRPESSIHFFTSGGGSKAFKGLREYGEVEGVRFVFDGQGFLAVSMREDSVVLSFYDVFGNVPYSYTLQR